MLGGYSEGVATPSESAGGTVIATSMFSIVEKLGPSVFGSRPQQMNGSTSRMQGKEASEPRTKAKSTAGIDVSQETLDAHVFPSEDFLQVPNTAQGIRQLKRFLIRYDLSLVVVEATGKWHRAVRRSLFADHFPVAEVDPYKVRMFARAQGVLAKNDRLDARVLAQFAAVMTPSVRPPLPENMEELSELVRARASAVAEQTALKNQHGTAASSFLRHHFKLRIARAGKDIQALDAEILTRIKADEALARRYTILTSMPGVGFVVAATFIANLTELGTCSEKAIAKLAGLAPHDDDSGKHRGPRVIWGGRADVRRAAYLAGFTAVRHNPDLKAMFERMIAAGKPFKVAVIAAARKIVILANILISQDRKWQAVAPKSV
jgi:transposase